jgi:hypothetical protein
MSLPEMAVLLIRLIGSDAALRMMEPANYGGKSYLVPKFEIGRGEQAFAALAESIGMENAKLLCKHFGGENIYVPLLNRFHLAARNRAIVAAYVDGSKSVWELSTEHKMSGRRIWQILKTTNMNENNETLIQDAQHSLF